MKRAALFCPGRGSYTKKSLRSLPPDHEWVLLADALRAQYDLPPLTALDGAPKFDPPLHLQPQHVSPLIYVATMLDAAQAKREYEAVCVGGNSMGWYSALAVAGALSFEDGFRLVQEMSILQQEAGAGGQVIYPVIDDQWRADPRLLLAVREALTSSNGEALPSIDLGGYAVLAGSEAGIEHLLKALPPVEMGPSLYPFRLAQHGPYHTPLLGPVAERAQATLLRLGFRAPEIALVDGRGALFSPWSSDPDAIAAYTLGAQIVEPYRFSASVRTALREYAPDRIVLPGPGNSLGGVCGQIVCAEGWRGVRTRDAFEAIQSTPEPIVHSMRRF